MGKHLDHLKVVPWEVQKSIRGEKAFKLCAVQESEDYKITKSKIVIEYKKLFTSYYVQ